MFSILDFANNGNIQIQENCAKAIPFMCKTTNEFEIYFSLINKIMEYGLSKSSFKKKLFLKIIKSSFSIFSNCLFYENFYPIFCSLKNDQCPQIREQYLNLCPHILKKLKGVSSNIQECLNESISFLANDNDKYVSQKAKQIEFEMLQINDFYVQKDASEDINEDELINREKMMKIRKKNTEDIEKEIKDQKKNTYFQKTLTMSGKVF